MKMNEEEVFYVNCEAFSKCGKIQAKCPRSVRLQVIPCASGEPAGHEGTTALPTATACGRCLL